MVILIGEGIMLVCKYFAWKELFELRSPILAVPLQVPSPVPTSPCARPPQSCPRAGRPSWNYPRES